MDKQLRLDGEKVVLRSFVREDAEQLVKWRQDMEVIRYFLDNKPLTMERHLDWFDNDYMNNPERVDFVIFEKETERPVGTAGIKAFEEGCPEVSYAIGEKDMRGKGLAKDAILTLMRYAKECLGAARVAAGIHHDNAASRGIAGRLGFQPGEKMAGHDDFTMYFVDLE